MAKIHYHQRTRRILRTRDVTWIIVVALIAVISAAHQCAATPLEFSGITMVSFEGYFSRIEGRMGFDQQLGGIGTLNDLKQDLGLPADNRSFRLLVRVRPLEHHLLRMYGTIPQYYRGSTTLQRQLQTRNVLYPVGTNVSSTLRTAQAGFGYDLDFLIGPKWFAGLNGDLRYVDIKATMGEVGSGLEDTISIDEMTPCLGAHMGCRFPFGLSGLVPGLTIGGYSRLTYGITPNFFNYVDIIMGVRVGTRPDACVALNAKVGYKHESFFHNQEQFSSRIFELKRDGVSFLLEAAF